MSVCLLIVNEDKFVPLYDKIGFFELCRFINGRREDMFEKLLKLDLKLFLFCKVILLNRLRRGLGDMIKIRLNKELNLIIISNGNVINSQYGLNMVLSQQIDNIINGEVDIRNNFIKEVIPRKLISILIEFVFDKGLHRQWLIMVVNQ